MHISEIFAKRRTTFSFEFFPPRSGGAIDSLFSSIWDFEKLQPSFVSVTYGAGGSTRDQTRDLVVRLNQETALDPIPHLTSVCHDEKQIMAILERYAEHGISNIMALRGDPPQGDDDYDAHNDAFKHASQLVSFIKKFNEQHNHPHPDGFGIGVAGYPEGHYATPNRMLELDYLKAKVDAGADFIATQLFFSNRDFYDFRDRCRLSGITVPILAGLMPITSIQGMKRMAELALGVRYPAPLIRAINRTGGDPDAVRRVGVHWATEQARDLLDHDIDGIHFYTLNKSTATREIYHTLGVKNSLALE